MVQPGFLAEHTTTHSLQSREAREGMLLPLESSNTGCQLPRKGGMEATRGKVFIHLPDTAVRFWHMHMLVLLSCLRVCQRVRGFLENIRDSCPDAREHPIRLALPFPPLC